MNESLILIDGLGLLGNILLHVVPARSLSKSVPFLLLGGGRPTARQVRRATMAASLRAPATRILGPGEGLRARGLFRTQHQQLSKSTHAYEEGHRAYNEHRALHIQQTKEQLYDLIAGAEANSKTFLLNKGLLKNLSTQVKPRPEDPQWCKITRTKKVTDLTMSAGILVFSGLTYCALTSCPEIVKYGDYLVTAESLPLIRESLRRQVIQERLLRVSTAEGVNKQDGHQPVATAEGVDKQ